MFLLILFYCKNPFTRMPILLVFSFFSIPLFIIQNFCLPSYKIYKNSTIITQPKKFLFSFTFSARNVLNKYKNSNSRSMLRERNGMVCTSEYTFSPSNERLALRPRKFCFYTILTVKKTYKISPKAYHFCSILMTNL